MLIEIVDIELIKRRKIITFLQNALEAYFPQLMPTIEDLEDKEDKILISFSLSDTEVLRNPEYSIDEVTRNLETIVKQVEAIVETYKTQDHVNGE